MEPLVAMRLATEARSLYEDPAFRRAYAKLYQGALDEIRHSAPEAVAVREAAYARMKTLEMLDKELSGTMAAPGLDARRRDLHRQER